ncbi:hypothetical protein [Tritonibacter mobilis]|uniref:hypothetical protein n=1 Tax=Tritonibacter mobilis TaxID=379347 RepID=UPI001CD9E69D|nr:hypothetical protein [Tritonibacter mobilis]MCA2009137.1 hypothetical protein [Tritonibacter mobilis]
MKKTSPIVARLKAGADLEASRAQLDMLSDDSRRTVCRFLREGIDETCPDGTAQETRDRLLGMLVRLTAEGRANLDDTLLEPTKL